MLARIKRLLPSGWFGFDLTPILDSALEGPASALAFIYSIYAYAKLQTRILTASDGWLDLAASDFFGQQVVRAQNQSDTSFRANIIANLFRVRDTRAAVTAVLTAITGQVPLIVEPWRLADTGAWDVAMGYDVAGYWGGDELTYQSFVTAYRPAGIANANLGGWDVPMSGWDAGTCFFAEDTLDGITDADIIAAVESVRMAGTVIWLQIAAPPTAPNGGTLDFTDPTNSDLIPNI
jgi:hypothetical protein